jgi:hypothetical protein
MTRLIRKKNGAASKRRQFHPKKENFMKNLGFVVRVSRGATRALNTVV